MKSVSLPTELKAPALARRTDVDEFIDAVRKEQVRYLETIRQAAATLRVDDGRLACVAATQTRLTQQLFDAQRSILQRRAEFDAEVECIDLAAEEDARAIVSAATGVVREAATLEGAIPLDVVEAEQRRSGTHGDEAQRQLAALLDDWWTEENREGRAMVADACARATMRRQLATIEAGTFLEPVGVHDPAEVISHAVEPEQRLPRGVLEVLAEVDRDDLATLLTALAESLDPAPMSVPSAARTASPPSGDLVLDVARLAAPPSPHVNRPTTLAGRHAACRSADSDSSSESLGRAMARIVMPFAAISTAVTILMAWVG